MEINFTKQAARIQTSFLNASEKKALVWLAGRQPKWVSSDLLSLIGFIGALIVATGYALTGISIHFLWLASLGFVINWYGDSLDGTLARVRNSQRPVYGFYLDHTLDCVSEFIMIFGLGLSPMMDMRIALLILVAYLLMTINVTINTHLKSEFRLTYAKLGPTEFRILAIIINTILILVPAFDSLLNYAGIAVFAIIMLMYTVTVISDAKAYSKADPKK